MPSATLPTQLVMPPEHHPHTRTLTAWPDQSSQPDPATLAGAERDVAAISQAIARFEPVTLYCRPENISRAQQTLKSTATATHSNTTNYELEIRPLAIDELWIRDTGPVYVHAESATAGRSLAGLDLNFNCWGNKYSDTNTNSTASAANPAVDAHVASLILADQSHLRIAAPFTAEGGALELDAPGGTLLATESSILNANRNAGVDRAEMEARLKAVLGVKRVLWLPGAKGRDVTDGHVDGLARFVCGGEKVVLSRPHANSGREAWGVFEEARRVLGQEKGVGGGELAVVEVGEADPARFKGVEEYQLCLSYVNYLVINGGVVMPAFGDLESDEKALQAMRKLFPEREVVQVLLKTICRLGGGIHCATQQVPSL